MKRPFLEKFAPTIIFRKFKVSNYDKESPGEAPTIPTAVVEAETTLSTEQPTQARAHTVQLESFMQKKGTDEVILVSHVLISELRSNSKIASRAQLGDLKSFTTKVWESTSGGLLNLPEDIKEELSQAYVDMKLANSVVWVAVELKRRNPNLEDNYRALCRNISARLNTIIPVLERNNYNRNRDRNNN